MKKHYHGVFTKTKDAIEVEIPDVEGCVTFGNSFEVAYEMAIDALAAVLANSDIQFIGKEPVIHATERTRVKGVTFVNEMAYRQVR